MGGLTSTQLNTGEILFKIGKILENCGININLGRR